MNLSRVRMLTFMRPRMAGAAEAVLVDLERSGTRAGAGRAIHLRIAARLERRTIGAPRQLRCC
jgi:hypothetical protein